MSQFGAHARDGNASRTPSIDAAEQLRGFGRVGLLALLLILAGNLLVVHLSGVLVLVWAHFSHTPLWTSGFAALRCWTATVGIGLPFTISLQCFLQAIVVRS